MTKETIIWHVAAQISNMIYNDIVLKNGVECFEAWCEDGEVFDLLGLSDEEVNECLAKVKEVAPIVDDLVLNHLNANSMLN